MSETEDEYTCTTQAGFGPAFDIRLVPKTQSDGKTRSLVIGSVDRNKLIVPRWDIRTQPNQKLRYFVRKETFQAETDDPLTTAERAQFAADALEQAAEEWNNLDFGLSIVPTDDKATANFYLVYLDPNSPKFTPYASAFFPHRPGRDVIVYRKALRPDKRAGLKSVLLHELGHALGLRHEFAITGDGKRKAEDQPAVQFMETNPVSVMSYSVPPTIQESDKDGIKGLYELANGHPVSDDVLVKDFSPWKRSDYPDADEVVQWMLQEFGTAPGQGNTGTNANPISNNPPSTDTGLPRPTGGDSTNPPPNTDTKGNDSKGTPNQPLPIPTPAKPSVPVTNPSDKGSVARPADQGTKTNPSGAASAPRPAGTGIATTVGGKVVVPVAAPKPTGPAAGQPPVGPSPGSHPTGTGTAPKPAPPVTATKPPIKGPAGHS